MKRIIGFGFLMLFAPAIALSQSVFDGTWKADLGKSQLSQKPDVFSVHAGMYHCKTCVPPIDVKADGQDQKVAGHPYYDSVSVRVVDDRTIEETDKKDGKTVATSKMTASSDGKTLTYEFSDSSATNGDPVTGKGEMTRVAKGAAGSHAISGSWRNSKMESMSDNATSITYKVDGGTLNMTSPTGQSYSAKLDGTEAPYKGDPGTSSVSVKQMGKNVIEETDKRDGKVISVARISVGADGKTMSITVNDKLHGTTNKFVATKQ
jgi:hypothetical protein